MKQLHLLLGGIHFVLLLSFLNGQEIPASALESLVHYSSFDRSFIQGGTSTADGPLTVDANIGTAGSAGADVLNGAVATIDRHIFAGGSTGFLGSSVTFPGSQNAGILFEEIPPPGTGDFSVSIWFGLPDDPQNGMIASSGNPGSSAEGWSIFYENGSLIYRMSLGGGGADLRASVNSSSVSTGLFHHAVLVIDSTNEIIRGYLDGEEVTNVGGGGPPDETYIADDDGIANEEPVLVGARSNGGFEFLGSVDDFAVWTKALNAAEIKAIYDAGEARIGLIPAADTDEDGMPDDFEDEFASLNPDDPSDAEKDQDNDELTNLMEYDLRTNPIVADTDQDGLLDGDEINTHLTNPLLADSDGDGLDDEAEVIEHKSDPNKTDTDGDTFDDAVEVAEGTNPNDPNEFPGKPDGGGGLLDGLIHYSSFDNFSVGAGAGTDTTEEAPFAVEADVGTAGIAGGEVANGPIATFDSHITSGTEGRIGEALTFPSGEEGGVLFEEVPSPGTGDFSVSVWFNFHDAPQNGMLVSHGNRTSGDEGWSIFWENGALIYRLSVGGGGSDLRAAVNGPLDGDAEWHHAVLIGDSEAAVVRGYLDGVELTETGKGGPPDETFVPDDDGIDNDNPVLLAARTGGGFPFAGSLDDFAVWSRVLTPDEVTSIFEQGQTGNSFFGSTGPGLQITDIEFNPEPQEVILTWATRPNRTYAIEFSTDLQDWSEVDDGVAAGDGETTSYSDTTELQGKTTGYYRVLPAN